MTRPKWQTLLAALFFSAATSFSAQAACTQAAVDLRGDWGQARFSVEIADDPQERSQGLMHRTSMPQRSGMLFVYDKPLNAVFWMKNTLIPLDMIFLDRSGRVTHVHHEAIPGDLTPIDGGENVLAVLEINGGLARKYGIAKGTEMRHEVFSNGSPVWPC
ncbi:MAG: DUF192 domain-containing protein [Rhodobacteraceae bacterium]|nr:DUF192 domain-containing protein [Paracoccaceae bacterium]